MVLLQTLLVAMNLAGLGLTGLGIDYIRSEVDPESPAPQWPLGLVPPSDWTPMQVVFAVAAAVLAMALLNAGLKFGAALATADVTQRILVQLRSDVYEKLQQLSFHFFDANASSSIINRAAGDVNAVRMFVDGVLVRVLTTTLTLIVYLVYMLNVHVPLTVVCLLSSPLLWVGAVTFSRMVQPAYRKASELGDEMVLTLVENVQGIHVVKGFGREPEQIEQFSTANRKIREQKESIFHRVSTFQPLMGLLTQVNMLVLIGYGGYLVIHNELPLGAGMFVFANLLHEFANQVGQITNIANTIQSSLIAGERVFEVLDTPVQIVSAPDALPLGRCRGEVKFEHVSFAYFAERPVLEDVSFEVRPGECLAITGETGSGKSTLLSLLMRFYDVTAGSVQVDGMDVRRLNLDDLRRNMGLVFQDSFLFSNTVAANIAFGHPEASDDQIVHAAKLSAAHEFVAEMPDGYETVVGEHGANLSGGQRQRLALARALLLDPPLLLLDDATASIDPETEHEIQESLNSAAEGRTTIVISNRISTLRRADQILVMQSGRIIARGTHDDLMRRPGYYRKLAELQFADQLDERVVEHEAVSAAGGA
jgi:ATP-binding cassette subfamily B protein